MRPNQASRNRRVHGLVPSDLSPCDRVQADSLPIRSRVSFSDRPSESLQIWRGSRWSARSFRGSLTTGGREHEHRASARTRFIDDVLVQALHDGVQQVVILGAGFDCRAYRLPGMDRVRVIEVDHPDTQRSKT